MGLLPLTLATEQFSLSVISLVEMSSLALRAFLRKIRKGRELEHRKWNEWQGVFGTFCYCQHHLVGEVARE